MKDRLLSGPRAVVRDLVDKRLWPIAIVLVVALVAVPVAISRSGGAAPAVAPVTAAAGAGTGADSAISVEAPPVLGRSRPGAVHDPFYDPPAPKSSSTARSSVASPPTPTTAPAAKPADSAVATPPANAGTPASPTTTAPGSNTATGTSVFRTRVSWGADAGAAVRGLSRLEPLGGTSDPALLYLGTNEDHKRALFLLGPNALAGGQPACAETSCRIIELQAGQSASIGVVGQDGAADRRYELKVAEIAEQTAADETEALALRSRVHTDGRDVLRAMVKDPKTALAVGQFTYDRSRGAVVTSSAP